MSFIYLATPYSHPDLKVRERRWQLACMATAKLIERGEIVYCPVVHSHRLVADGHLSDHVTLAHWQAIDMGFIRVCSELWVVQLAGWQISKGVEWKIKLAHHLNIPVQHWKPSDFLMPEE
jgi:hypothetical protein